MARWVGSHYKSIATNRAQIYQLWELMEAERGLGEEWRWLEDEEKVKVLLGQDMEGGERIDRSVKSYLRKVMDKRRRWMGLGTMYT